MSEPVKLEPCPFCGRTPQLELFNDGFFDYARLRCCHLIFDWCGDKTGDKVSDAWNRRAQPDNPPLTVEQLREMNNKWVWIEYCLSGGKHYSGWGKIIQTIPIVSSKIIEENPGYITECDISRYNAKFYAYKPEEA